jgi:pantothenate kinase
MPVTARLSRKFYETFGDEIANELVDWFNQVDLTYRTDLERVNELNYARFDARVEQRFAEMRAYVDIRFGELEARWEKRFTELEARTDQRFAELRAYVDARFVEFEARTDQRFTELRAYAETRLAEQDARLGRRIADLETRLIRWVIGLWLATALGVLGLLRL